VGGFQVTGGAIDAEDHDVGVLPRSDGEQAMLALLGVVDRDRGVLHRQPAFRCWSRTVSRIRAITSEGVNPYTVTHLARPRFVALYAVT